MKRANYLILSLGLFVAIALGGSAYASQTPQQSKPTHRPADFVVEGVTSYTPKNPLTLWYDRPVRLYKVRNQWMECSLPIGNGEFGASIFGGVQRDEIQFNEKSLWSGRNSDVGVEYGDYENFGSVFVEDLSGTFGHTPDKAVKEYLRQLDLKEAKVSVSYKSPDAKVSYGREYIASNPDNVVVARYSASSPGALHLRITLHSGKPGINAVTRYEANTAQFGGKLETVSYHAQLKVVNRGGKLTSSPEAIVVEGADEVMLVLAGDTDFDAYSPTYTSQTDKLVSRVESCVKAAAAKSWSELESAHKADYAHFFDRVDFSLVGSENNMPTDALVRLYAERKSGVEANVLMLEQLYFAYGRYLEIASSRGVDLPSNLQGIWNNSSEPPWNSDIHSNINVQMNYWPAENTNLSEMHLPFLNYIINMATNHTEWAGYAKASGQSKGWTCYTENNIFGGVGSFMHNYVIANAWYCTHLWQHYRYTLDEEFLARAFPAMWSATEYWLERLMLDKDGLYVCPQEYSPEHGPKEDGVAHAQQLVWDLFANTEAAAKILGKRSGIGKAEIAMLEDRLSKLDKGLAIEKYTGEWGAEVNGIKVGDELLREWKYSTFTAGQNGHRHMSHLMCIYPFNQVTADSPYYQAAINSMKLRGDASTGWSMGWKINLWARVGNGEKAHDILELALGHSSTDGTSNNHGGGVYYNLYDAHPPFQIDGNFGATAGIAEMLMQSHTGTIQILPALPEVWREGHIRGLKAVGDFTVDIEWQDGKAKRVVILNNQGSQSAVSYPEIASAKVKVDGKERKLKLVDGALALPAKRGAKVELEF